MTAGKYRAQILLEYEQHSTLVDIAEQESRSLSELIRLIVDEWLAKRADARVWDERLKSVERMAVIREQVEKSYGVYTGDLVKESREAQEHDEDRIWRGEA